MMMIVKLFEGRSTTPKFFIFKRVDDKKRFLVNYPIDFPDRKRYAKWFDFDEVRVEWIREFADE